MTCCSFVLCFLRFMYLFLKLSLQFTLAGGARWLVTRGGRGAALLCDLRVIVIVIVLYMLYCALYAA